MTNNINFVFEEWNKEVEKLKKRAAKINKQYPRMMILVVTRIAKKKATKK